MTNSPILVVQSKIQSGSFDEAHALLSQIVSDRETCPQVKADAYVWLGTLARIHPASSPDDESGLTHYLKALECNPNEVWAMIGIIESFGAHFPDHQKVALVREFAPRVLQLDGELSETVRASIISKLDLCESVLRQRTHAQKNAQPDTDKPGK